VDSLALGLRVVVRVSDGVVADGDRFNIGGDDPDFGGVDEDAVVVEDRLAIKLGFALVALLGCSLQCGLRAAWNFSVNTAFIACPWWMRRIGVQA